MGKLTITTEKEIFDLLKNVVDGDNTILDDIEELVIDKNLTTFQIRLFGENYTNACMPSKVMDCLIDFQKKVYNAYAVINYEGDGRNLTTLDRKKLEIYFEITKGSLDIGAALDFAKTFLKDMDSKDKKQIAIVSVLLFAGCWFGTNFTDNYFKSKEGDRSTTIQLATINALREKNPSHRKIIDDALKNKDKCIYATQDCDKIIFQGNNYSNNDIQNIISGKEFIEDSFITKKIIATFRIFKIENSYKSTDSNNLRISLIEADKLDDAKINWVKISEEIYNDPDKLNKILDAVPTKTNLKLEILVEEERGTKNIKNPVLLNIL